MNVRINIEKIKELTKNNIILNKIRSNKIAKNSSKYNSAIEDINKNEREYNYNKERERILYEYTRSNKFKKDISEAKKDHPTL